MLGRHSYRVHLSEGAWIVQKEGGDETRGRFATRDAAFAEACRIADSDQPSRVTVDDGDGRILEERLFGADLAQELGA